MADPGFPEGGADLVGGANSRGSYLSKNLYVETKESGHPLDPPMTTLFAVDDFVWTHWETMWNSIEWGHQIQGQGQYLKILESWGKPLYQHKTVCADSNKGSEQMNMLVIYKQLLLFFRHRIKASHISNNYHWYYSHHFDHIRNELDHFKHRFEHKMKLFRHFSELVSWNLGEDFASVVQSLDCLDTIVVIDLTG